jgi:8-oxo-dGTP diphosphatase
VNKYRTYLDHVIAGHTPLDAREAADVSLLQGVLERGQDLIRGAERHLPDPHLVSYFVPVDEATRRVLLIEHVRSGLLLPPGGHVEADETPLDTARRECVEELRVSANMTTRSGESPLFVTATRTVATTDTTPQHTDISLWYLVSLPVNAQVEYEAEAIAGGRWLSFAELAQLDLTATDLEMRRFVRKLAILYD